MGALLWWSAAGSVHSQTASDLVNVLVIEVGGKHYPLEQFMYESHDDCPTGAIETTQPDIPLPQPHYHTISGGPGVALDLTESPDPDERCGWGIIHTGFEQSANVIAVQAECSIVADYVRKTGMQAGTVFPQTVDIACGPAGAPVAPAGAEGTPSAGAGGSDDDASEDDASDGGGLNVALIAAPAGILAIALACGYALYQKSQHDTAAEEEDQTHRPDDPIDRDVEDPAYDPERDEPERVQPGEGPKQAQSAESTETWRNPTGRETAEGMFPFTPDASVIEGGIPEPMTPAERLQREMLENPPDLGNNFQPEVPQETPPEPEPEDEVM